jgi:hypothetical protein
MAALGVAEEGAFVGAGASVGESLGEAEGDAGDPPHAATLTNMTAVAMATTKR